MSFERDDFEEPGGEGGWKQGEQAEMMHCTTMPGFKKSRGLMLPEGILLGKSPGNRIDLIISNKDFGNCKDLPKSPLPFVLSACILICPTFFVIIHKNEMENILSVLRLREIEGK